MWGIISLPLGGRLWKMADDLGVMAMANNVLYINITGTYEAKNG